jgi:hypothetical protein
MLRSRRITEWPFILYLTLVNERLVSEKSPIRWAERSRVVTGNLLSSATVGA